MELLRGIGSAFRDGGWGMYPIAFVLILIVAVGIDRYLCLYKRSVFNKASFLSNMRNYILQGNITAAINYCNSSPSPLARVIKAGLLKVNKSDEEVQAALDEASLKEMPLIERRTGYLAMLGNVSTLAGLLGTITGLIKSFRAVSFADPAEKAGLLAAGISEAMNCTAFGLGAAIPALCVFALFQGKTQTIVDGMNEVSVTVLNLVVNNRDKINLKDLPQENA